MRYRGEGDDVVMDRIGFTRKGFLPKTREGTQSEQCAPWVSWILPRSFVVATQRNPQARHTRHRRYGFFELDHPASLAAVAKCGTLARRRFDACHRSYCACIPIHNSGLVPSASESRKAISADIPALPLRMRDRVARVTPKCLAASVMDTPPR
jgi:hypothetical protein